MRATRILLAALLVLGVGCALIFGLGKGRPEESGQESEAGSRAESAGNESGAESGGESAVESADESDEESYPFYHSDDETYGIDTAYATLRYPTRWQELTVTRSEGEGLSFYARTGQGEVRLFTLHFEDAPGFLLGYLSADGRELPVMIESFSVDAEALSEEDYFNCCAMSEDINVIISHLIDEYGLHSKKQESQPEESAPDESRSESGEESVPFYHSEGEMFEIDTPFATLKYPLQWQDRLSLSREEGSPYRVHFNAKTAAGTVPLFTLNFGGGDGYQLGVLSDGTKLFIESCAIDSAALSPEDYEACCAMCEAVNDTLSFLIEECGLRLGEGGDPAEESLMTLTTPYAELRYPAKWKEYLLTVLNTDQRCKLSFLGRSAAGDQQLFDLFFGAGDGYLLGYISCGGERVPLYVESYGFEREGLSDDEFDRLCAMQEDVNVILEYLTKEYGLSDEAGAQDDGRTFTVNTKYAALEYPLRWQDRTVVKISQSGVYTVSFSVRTAAGTLPLFDLQFEGGDGYLLGLLPYRGEEIELRIVSYNIDRSALSAEEFETFCAMQEDVNVIISGLAEKSGLEF